MYRICIFLTEHIFISPDYSNSVSTVHAALVSTGSGGEVSSRKRFGLVKLTLRYYAARFTGYFVPITGQASGHVVT